jgi:hypothetical protein
LCLFWFQAQAAVSLQTGDIIFHKSRGSQFKAIEEAQGSPYTHMGVLVREGTQWFVYEAIQPVGKASLATWIRRGQGAHYVLKRIKPEIKDMSVATHQKQLVAQLKKYFGFNYDIFFEWSDDRIYCSELAFKGYLDAFSVPVGKLQKVGELDLTGPNIKKLIREREKLMGHPIDLNEPIITPLSMLTAEELIEVDQGILGIHLRAK